MVQTFAPQTLICYRQRHNITHKHVLATFSFKFIIALCSLF